MTEDSPVLDPAPAIGRAPGDQETPRPDPLAHPADRDPAEAAQLALVTGASGYVGGQLIPALLAAGWRVRVLTRRRSGVAAHPWAHLVEVFEGDAADPVAVGAALAGADVAYYLIHSMGDAADYAARDRELAHTFATAARAARVPRIVYLSGLHPAGATLSPHLASRVEVGRILLDSGVPTAVLQAAVVLGSGSASFDMLRYLAGRLPAMVAPKWLRSRVQPIAVADVLGALVGAATLPTDVNRTFDIGGPEVMTYEEMLQRFAAVTGLRRRVIVTLPVLTPGLASHWVGLVTPVDAGVAKPLVGSLVHDVVCAENDLDSYLTDPPAGRIGFDDAVRSALADAPADHGLRDAAGVVAATALSAGLGALATSPASRWYRDLDLPAWQPPRAAFPAVWTLLYADIALVSARTLSTLEHERAAAQATRYRRALAANLALNTAWSLTFWRARRPALAAATAGILTLSAADLARRAAQADRGLGSTLAPYPLWCGFATALSGAIARRNRVR